MANRHSNKQRRAGVRRRMAATGESYQQALAAIRRGTPQPDAGVDLLVVSYFGAPITLAVFEARQPLGRPAILRVPSSRGLPPSGSRWLLGMPTPFEALRGDGWQ